MRRSPVSFCLVAILVFTICSAGLSAYQKKEAERVETIKILEEVEKERDVYRYLWAKSEREKNR